MNIVTLQRPRQESRGYWLIGRTLASIRPALRIARDIRRLERMSDYELRDIGLSRNEIRFAVRHGRNRDIAGHWRYPNGAL